MAVLVPLLCINTFSAKYDMHKFYPRLIQSLVVTGLAGGSYYYVREQQRALFGDYIKKYFTHLTDD